MWTSWMNEWVTEGLSQWLTTPAQFKKIGSIGNGLRGRKGEVIKSRIPKEAIGGVCQSPGSKLYSNVFPSFSSRGSGARWCLCSQSCCHCLKYQLVKCQQNPECESTGFASPLSEGLLCQQVVWKPGNCVISGMATVPYVFFIISFLGRGSPAFVTKQGPFMDYSVTFAGSCCSCHVILSINLSPSRPRAQAPHSGEQRKMSAGSWSPSSAQTAIWWLI